MASSADRDAWLRERWPDLGLDASGERQVVVLPSMTIGIPAGRLPSATPMLAAREERLLCLLLLLAKPRTSVVYVSSVEVPPAVVDYWLALVSGPHALSARRRLSMVALSDAAPRPLSAKLLDSAAALARIRELIADPRRAYLLPIVADDLEARVAGELGVPMFAARPEAAGACATKSGSRRLFAASGVPHPAGIEGVRTGGDVLEAIRSLRAEAAGENDFVVKWDRAGGGHGNAIIRATGARSDEELRARILALEPDDADTPPKQFFELLDQRGGGVVEELITGLEVRSPSAQLRISPVGEVEVLATHDQILGGRTGQRYIGCRYPANAAYASEVVRQAAVVGRELARRGIIGHAGVDFIASRDRNGSWTLRALEINLRLTGTMHHAYTLRLVAGSSERSYLGSESVSVANDASPAELVRRVQASGAAWDPEARVGVVLQTVAAAGPTGTVGLTAIGRTAEEAAAHHKRAAQALSA